MRQNPSKTVALGGVLAAVAVVIMCLGGMIPLATYICPVLCIVVQNLVLRFCGKRVAWAWFAVVSILAMLLGPDKEAAAVFLLLGYYPIIKTKMDCVRFRALWKLLYFNATVAILYTLLLRFLGLEEAVAEFRELGVFGLAVMLLLGNATFVLVDKVLDMMNKKMR